MSNKRILIKLSGEALSGTKGFGIEPSICFEVAKEIEKVIEIGYQVAVVVGGGNIWRGQTGVELGMSRSQADYMGMLATMMNGLALQDSLENSGIEARVQTALHTDQVAAPYIRRKAIRDLEKNRVVILAGGTGMPYFTTDTNSMLRASELGVDTVLMAKNGVDGVYDKDPNVFDDATKFSHLTYQEILEKKLMIMDLTASTIAQENEIKTIVFNMNEESGILKALTQDNYGTKIS